MTCTRCHKPIALGQPYHRTRRGPHHRACPGSQQPDSIHPSDFLDWYNTQKRAGLHQRQCPLCGLHKFPQEFISAAHHACRQCMNPDAIP